MVRLSKEIAAAAAFLLTLGFVARAANHEFTYSSWEIDAADYKNVFVMYTFKLHEEEKYRGGNWKETEETLLRTEKDFRKLMEDYEDSETAWVGEAICDNPSSGMGAERFGTGARLCKEQLNKFDGELPWFKYGLDIKGDHTRMVAYNGGSDLLSLYRFAEENIGPICGPTHPELCKDASTKSKWEKLLTKTKPELEAIVKKLQAKRFKFQEDHDKLLKDLFDDKAILKHKRMMTPEKAHEFELKANNSRDDTDAKVQNIVDAITAVKRTIAFKDKQKNADL